MGGAIGFEGEEEEEEEGEGEEGGVNLTRFSGGSVRRGENKERNKEIKKERKKKEKRKNEKKTNNSSFFTLWNSCDLHPRKALLCLLHNRIRK